MKRLTFLLLLLCYFPVFSQQKNENLTAFQSAIGYLKWYKTTLYSEENNNQKVNIYPLVQDIPINKTYKRQVISQVGVRKFVEFYQKSGFLSSVYLDGLRTYFDAIQKELKKSRPMRRNEMIKIDGLDRDIQLQTFEPEAILDHLDHASLTRSLVIYNKALLGIHFDQNVDMVFTLTKHQGKWLIDNIDHDNTSEHSFFRQ